MCLSVCVSVYVWYAAPPSQVPGYEEGYYDYGDGYDDQGWEEPYMYMTPPLPPPPFMTPVRERERRERERERRRQF